MNKLIFAILAISFVVLSAIADTTYVCSQIGDWNPWGVPYAKQKELVGKGVVMEITEGDEESTVAASINQQYLNVCKNSPDCYDPCKSEDYPDNCPCPTCCTEPDGTAVMVNTVVDYILAVY